MRALLLAAFVTLALVAPSTPVVDEAEARPDPIPTCIQEPCGPTVPCLYGSDSDCIIHIVCVTSPCEPERFP